MAPMFTKHMLLQIHFFLALIITFSALEKFFFTLNFLDLFFHILSLRARTRMLDVTIMENFIL